MNWTLKVKFSHKFNKKISILVQMFDNNAYYNLIGIYNVLARNSELLLYFQKNIFHTVFDTS